MKINKNDFSFEESLKYLDRLGADMTDNEGMRAFRSMEQDELPVDRVVKVFCVAMSIKIIKKFSHAGVHTEYVHAGTVSQILHVLQSAVQLRQVEMQVDGGIMALFDAPMKKDVEDIINISAQVRSINDVVLKKFRLPLGEQTVSVGLEYGPVSYFASRYSNLEGVCYGGTIQRAKKLADVKDDSVNISEDIYMNLSEDMQDNLFVNKEMTGDVKYFFSQLINIRMRKWVVENK